MVKKKYPTIRIVSVHKKKLCFVLLKFISDAINHWCLPLIGSFTGHLIIFPTPLERNFLFRVILVIIYLGCRSSRIFLLPKKYHKLCLTIL